MNTIEHEKIDITLDKAADYIEEHGWTRGILVDTDGSVCALGALKAAIWGVPHPKNIHGDDARYELQRDCINRFNRITDVSMIDYNDRVAKNKDEVVYSFRKAAKL